MSRLGPSASAGCAAPEAYRVGLHPMVRPLAAKNAQPQLIGSKQQLLLLQVEADIPDHLLKVLGLFFS